MNKILITNIQRFSLHDGPGIRTTVFLKGCSLRCPWCSNPENMLPEQQAYINDGISGIYGRFYTTEELVKECLKDKVFYKGDMDDPKCWNISSADDLEYLPGGVTFSGGECLLQIDSLIPVILALHEQGVHVAAESCLYVPETSLKAAINHIDLFYVDVKILDPNRCKDVEHGQLEMYLDRLELLFKSGSPIVLRIPVIGSYTDTYENRKAVHDLLTEYKKNILKVELIKEHKLGESKYKSLNMKMDYHGVEDSLMELYRKELNDVQLPIEICSI